MNTTLKHAVLAAIAVVCLTGIATSVRADETNAAAATSNEMVSRGMTPLSSGEGDDKWTFNSPLYAWGIALNGTVNHQGDTIHVSQSFSDLFQHLDKGFTAYFELAKPQYGFYVNPNYFELTWNSSGSGNDYRLTTQLWIIEAAGYYRIWHMEGDRPAGLYVVGGARYWNIHNNLHEETVGADASTKWLLDPMLGLRFKEFITPRFHIGAQTDIGGFDLAGQTSRFSWQLMATAGWDFTMPVVKFPSTVFLGWRQINDQKSNNNNGYNLNFSGMLVGLNVSLF
jgi:hypothetical protein